MVSLALRRLGFRALGAFQRRRLAEPDFPTFAKDHWNFNVRNFNPGGNRGSFLRASTHAVLLFAGGADTGIPRHRQVEEPTIA